LLRPLSLNCRNIYFLNTKTGRFVKFCRDIESDWRCFRGCAICSSHGRSQDFFSRRGGDKFRDVKSGQHFLVFTLETQVSTVTTNAQNTLQHFQGEASALKRFSFFRRGACAQWHNGRSKPGGHERPPTGPAERGR